MEENCHRQIYRVGSPLVCLRVSTLLIMYDVLDGRPGMDNVHQAIRLSTTMWENFCTKVCPICYLWFSLFLSDVIEFSIVRGYV